MASNNDIDLQVLLNLNIDQLKRTCKRNPKLSYICRSNKFWLLKLEQDFPDEQFDIRSAFEEYKRLSWMNSLSNECREFYRNPKVNPYTQRPISPTGKIYRDLVVECGDPLRKDYESFCDKFHQNPKVDPLTGNNQPLFGTKYNDLVEKCGDPPEHKNLTTCEKFDLNPTINPNTGYPISIGTKTYQTLMEQCHPFQTLFFNFLKQSPRILPKITERFTK